MNSTSIDLITRIKNGYMAEKKSVEGVYSKLNQAVLDILKTTGYIQSYSVEEDSGKKILLIELSYDADEKPALSDVKIVSTPGQRIYRKVKDLQPVLGGLGIAIISTSHGVLTDTEARKQSVGGEVLFEIW